MSKADKMTVQERREITAYCKRNARRVEKHLKAEYDEADLETSAADLLGNLMHLARFKGWDWWELDRRARNYFREETAGGELGPDNETQMPAPRHDIFNAQ